MNYFFPYGGSWYYFSTNRAFQPQSCGISLCRRRAQAAGEAHDGRRRVAYEYGADLKSPAITDTPLCGGEKPKLKMFFKIDFTLHCK